MASVPRLTDRRWSGDGEQTPRNSIGGSNWNHNNNNKQDNYFSFFYLFIHFIIFIFQIPSAVRALALVQRHLAADMSTILFKKWLLKLFNHFFTT